MTSLFPASVTRFIPFSRQSRGFKKGSLKLGTSCWLFTRSRPPVRAGSAAPPSERGYAAGQSGQSPQSATCGRFPCVQCPVKQFGQNTRPEVPRCEHVCPSALLKEGGGESWHFIPHEVLLRGVNNPNFRKSFRT